MPNFIERTLAEAAGKKAAAEQEARNKATAYAREERERVSRAAVEASESEKKEAHLRQAHIIFQKTGIKQTVEAINGHKTELEDVYNDRRELRLTLLLPANKDQNLHPHRNLVEITYMKDETLQIKGDKTQVLTAADLQNNDRVAAALEKAVANPIKEVIYQSPSVNYGDSGSPGY